MACRLPLTAQKGCLKEASWVKYCSRVCCWVLESPWVRLCMMSLMSATGSSMFYSRLFDTIYQPEGRISTPSSLRTNRTVCVARRLTRKFQVVNAGTSSSFHMLSSRPCTMTSQQVKLSHLVKACAHAAAPIGRRQRTSIPRVSTPTVPLNGNSSCRFFDQTLAVSASITTSPIMAQLHQYLSEFINAPLVFLYKLIQLLLDRLISPTPPPPNAQLGRPKIAIIGAGLTGVSSASHCVGHGFDVTLFEAGSRDAVGGIWAKVNNTSG